MLRRFFEAPKRASQPLSLPVVSGDLDTAVAPSARAVTQGRPGIPRVGTGIVGHPWRQRHRTRPARADGERGRLPALYPGRESGVKSSVSTSRHRPEHTALSMLRYFRRCRSFFCSV